MSAEATGWVFRHSAARGAVFQVHLAVADSVNDTHEHEFWMSMKRLGEKARVHRGTAQTSVGWLLDHGYLELISAEDRRRAGAPAHYRFLYPDVEVLFDSRRYHAATTRGTSRPGREEGRGPDATTTRPQREGPRGQDATHNNPRDNPSPTQEVLPAAKATDDPVKKAAHRLAVLAMEQPVKPDLRGDGANPFPAVMSLIERCLRTGRTVNALEAAILRGVDVWTLAGLQTAIAQARPRERNGGGIEQVIDELRGGAE